MTQFTSTLTLCVALIYGIMPAPLRTGWRATITKTIAAAMYSSRMQASGQSPDLKTHASVTRQLFLAKLRYPPHAVPLALSKDDKLLAIGTPFESLPAHAKGPIEIWNIPSATRLLTLKNAGDMATFAPNGRYLAVVSHWTLTVSVWDLTTKKRLYTITRPNRPQADGIPLWEIDQIAFSPDSKAIALGEGINLDFGDIRIYSARTGRQLRVLRGYTEPMAAMAFSPDNKTLVGGDQRNLEIWIWNRRTGHIVRNLNVPDYKINGYSIEQGYPDAFSYSPNGKILAIAGSERTDVYRDSVRLWNVHTGKIVKTLPENVLAPRIAFSPDGNTLLVCSSDVEEGDGRGRIILWNFRMGRDQTLLRDPSKMHSPVFSSNGKLLATSDNEGNIWLWHIMLPKVR